jgi:PAS domain S-box-containing protein
LSVDIYTLFIVLICANILQMAAILIQYWLNSNFKGMRWWIVGFAFTAVGFFLIYLRQYQVDQFFTIVLANIVLISSLLLHYVGIVRFLDRKENCTFIITLFTLLVMCYFCFTYLFNSVQLRNGFASLLSAVIATTFVLNLLIYKKRSNNASALFAASVILVQVVFFLLESITTFMNPPKDYNIFSPDTIQTLTLSIPLITGVLFTFGLVGLISQRTNSEMKEVKEHFEIFFNTSPDATAITRLNDGRIVDVNDVFVLMSGYSRAEVIGKLITDLNIWDNSTDRERLINELTKSGHQENFESTFRRKNGSRFIGSVSAQIINLDGMPHLISITHDITERKLAAKKLLESETRFRSIYESSPIGIQLYDENGIVVLTNPAYLKIFDINVGSDTRWLNLFNIPFYPSEINTLLKEKNEIRFETVFDFDIVRKRGLYPLSRTGQIILEVIITKFIYSDDAAKKGYLVQVQDITESKSAEERLRKSEEQYRLLVNNSHDIIYTLTPEGILEFVSPAWFALLGHPADQVIGKNFTLFVHPDDVENCWVNMKKSVETGKPISGVEYRVRHTNGAWRWHRSNGIAFKDTNGNLIVIEGIATDITQQKILEAEIKELYEKEKNHRQQLEEEAKTRIRFIDVLAHEMRGPLSPMLASSGMLSEILADNPDVNLKKLADNIYKGSQTLSNRLEELLEIARYARGAFTLKLEPIDMRQFISQITTSYSPMTNQRKQRLVTRITEDLPVIKADPSRMEQVIINLLSNASKYSPEESEILVNAVRKDNLILVEIKDQGIGISAEDQVKLFQPYQRIGDNPYKAKGLGLGLTLVKYIIEAHGGKIWVSSEPGKGSTFSFSIPVR